MAEKPAYQYTEAEWEASVHPVMTAPSVCSHQAAAIAAANGDWKAITLSGNYQQDRRFAGAKGLFATSDKPKKKALYRATEEFNQAIGNIQAA